MLSSAGGGRALAANPPPPAAGQWHPGCRVAAVPAMMGLEMSSKISFLSDGRGYKNIPIARYSSSKKVGFFIGVLSLYVSTQGSAASWELRVLTLYERDSKSSLT